MNKIGMTVIEILVVVVILGILGTIGAFTWDGVVYRVKHDICEGNQIIINEAIDMYIKKAGAIPTILSKLEPEYIDMATAKFRKENPFAFAKRKLYFTLNDLTKEDTALAQQFTSTTKVSQQTLACPLDPNGGISYGLNSFLLSGGSDHVNVLLFEIARMSFMPITCDCDVPTFNTESNHMVIGAANISFRHSRLFSPKKAIATYGANIGAVVPQNPSLVDFHSFIDFDKAISGLEEEILKFAAMRDQYHPSTTEYALLENVRYNMEQTKTWLESIE